MKTSSTNGFKKTSQVTITSLPLKWYPLRGDEDEEDEEEEDVEEEGEGL